MIARGPHTVVGSAPWRAEAARLQQAAVPDWDRVALTCSAPLGGGGLGRHLEELTGSLLSRDAAVRCLCEGRAPGAAALAADVTVPGESARGRALRALTPLGRLSPAIRIRLASAAFDADVAGALRTAPAAEALMGFNGTSLSQLRQGRARGRETALVSATVHARLLVRMQQRACARDPLERPWSPGILARNLREYELADTIYVSSRLAWESFVAEGIAEQRLRMFPLTPAERYRPDLAAASAAPTFDVVYVGGLTVDKGVPILVQAIRRLSHADLRLRLIGGWKTPGMRRFIQLAASEDSRISVGAADPLPSLRAARLYVHPAWSDGFGYAPAEAMACGVPVLVTDATGMSDLVGVAGPGAVLPTGDVDALSAAIDSAYHGAYSSPPSPQQRSAGSSL